MHKNAYAFTLIELLLSLVILSVAILGYLRVDLHSQQLLQHSYHRQIKQQYLQQFYEILQLPGSMNTICPACLSLLINSAILQRWQQDFIHALPGLSLHYLQQSSSQIDTLRARQTMQRFYCAGLSLLELMLGLLLGSLLLLSGIYLLQDTMHSYQQQQKAIRTLENTRYLDYWFSQAIHMAGYFGCHNLHDTIISSSLRK